MLEQATFGAGCFWGVEQAFSQIDGVTKTEVGYCGGKTKYPSYKDVSRGDTLHAEAVKVEFDTSKISYSQLVDKFWEIHDPTTLNKQGPDIGTQYRSVIFYENERQRDEALKSKEKVEKSRKFDKAIVTEIKPLGSFYKAEEYHQNYLKKNNLNSCQL